MSSPSRSEHTPPVVVVGGGLAGAACAAALARRGASVVLLEQEGGAGRHSSGRSAGLVRRAIADPVLARLTVEGAEAIARRAAGEPWFRRTGSVLVDPRGTIPSEIWEQIDHRPIDAAPLVSRLPWLRAASLDGAVLTPSDGVIDPAALLASLLEELHACGGEVRFGARVIRPLVEDGRVVAVELWDEELPLTDSPSAGSSSAGSSSAVLPVSALVVASGAWGAEWGASLGLPISLTPTRRSLQLAAPPEGGAADAPWVWHLDERWYARPGTEGVLLCAGEEHVDTPGDAQEDSEAEARFEWILRDRLALDETWPPLRRWSGHRTFLPDRRFLLGPDPRCAGWHWAVGLGGHGITTCLPVGERVATALIEGDPEAIEPEFRLRPAALSGCVRVGGEPRARLLSSGGGTE